MPRKKKVTEKPMTLSLRDGKAGDDRQMIPADNVDAEGTTWATVGENIRYGVKENNVVFRKELLDAFVSAVLGTNAEVITIECDLSGDNITYSPIHHNILGGTNYLIFKSDFMILSVNLNNTVKPQIDQAIKLYYRAFDDTSHMFLRLRESGYKENAKIKVTLGVAK